MPKGDATQTWTYRIAVASSVLVGTAAMLSTAASDAAAAPPTMTREEFSETSTDSSLCGFPIELNFEGSITIQLFFDNGGNLVRGQLVAPDVATATNPTSGKTLTGHEVATVHANLVNNTEFLAGVPLHFNTPGGTVLIDAGLIFDADTGQVKIVGNHQFIEGDLGAFCAALS